MRILHILNHSDWGHGIVHVAVDLACAQADAGHAVAYASRGGTLDGVLQTKGVERFPLDLETSRKTRAVAMFRELCAVIDTFKPDIVHAHMMMAAVLGYAATRIKRVPLITHVHNSFEKHATLMRFGDRIIAVSEAVAKDARERGMPADRIRVVLNGTEGSPRLPQPAPPPADLLHPNISTVCGMHPRKGVDHLIQAFNIVYAQRPEVHLYVVGDGPCRHQYEKIGAISPAADHIHFLGGIADPRPYMTSTDVFALASVAEPFGLVIAEARWAGCAVVASDVDGIPEALDGGRAGKLTPPANPQALAETLLAVLSTPQTLAQARRAAREGVERFTVARMATEVEATYREVVKRPLGRPTPVSAT